MNEEMRSRVSRQEIAFLLELLKDAEVNVNREYFSLSERAERMEISVSGLESRLRLGYYSAVKELRMSRERLQYLKFQTLPLHHRKRVVFRGLILKFERILSHKKGRMPFPSLRAVRWLKRHS